ncbi:bis(5'-nucleosyl)-tetraphosphatase (symmetrical) YqeK [Paenibacillus eucommiae]|uniref:bis(5'-nucleosyl)-tetraphosphatase (symmetrical) n=1 Tax=Paenibacillus eucommiae TaxID=1355755 RepID=A0ABS4IX62_9BACL|nr:bis(5'-nucleosyl)-tetraphosphatase (symmetrical) YqeK [Paenibacillus eucommiae]MBP1992183.1 putative HD superfamily hydrolase involved in NAD metabolism [Paenibacillus eucommiae]
MHAAYKPFTDGIILIGDLKIDIENFLNYHHEYETFEHTISVAKKAAQIAHLFCIDPELAAQAGLLHDVSNVIPVNMMMSIAKNVSVEILEEEFSFHRIIHQKLSRSMANHVFGCANIAVLNAIECHTTLKAGASQLAKVLFVADKISWVLPGEHPYQEKMREHIQLLDLNGAVLVYLDHVWEQRNQMKLVHPWLIEAREELLAAKRGNNRG